MNTPAITIESLLQRGQLYWKVRMGRRSLIFHQEQAARAFAAQLHVRLAWLQQSASPDDEFAPPGKSHE